MASMFYRETPEGKSYIDCIRRAHEVGFEVIDFNISFFAKKKSELLGDDWKARAVEIADEAVKLGVEFSQSHLPGPLPNIRNKDPYSERGEKNDYFRFCLEYGIRVASLLGVKWAVIHPVQNLITDEYSLEADIKYNHEIYDEFIELADKLGVGIAFENMADIDGRRRFGTTPDELIALIESYNSEQVKACWDFGHVNRCFTDQIRPLVQIGPYLRATHVDDNIGKDDLHTIPFFGTIPWPEIMTTLKQINYSGDFNFELSCFRRAPEALHEHLGRYIYEVGTYLIGLYDKA
jgi:sugar phosphate isomerase/epimerase